MKSPWNIYPRKKFNHESQADKCYYTRSNIGSQWEHNESGTQRKSWNNPIISLNSNSYSGKSPDTVSWHDGADTGSKLQGG